MYIGEPEGVLDHGIDSERLTNLASKQTQANAKEPFHLLKSCFHQIVCHVFDPCKWDRIGKPHGPSLPSLKLNKAPAVEYIIIMLDMLTSFCLPLVDSSCGRSCRSSQHVDILCYLIALLIAVLHPSQRLVQTKLQSDVESLRLEEQGHHLLS